MCAGNTTSMHEKHQGVAVDAPLYPDRVLLLTELSMTTREQFACVCEHDADHVTDETSAVAALEQAISARDEFLSIASHELKTPVTTLRLQVQSLLRTATRDPRAILAERQIMNRLESIERSAEQLTTLIDRLLDITRVTTGRLHLTREPLDLVAIVRRVIDGMEATLRDAGCEVSVASPEHVVGEWDDDRIETIITNLLANAVKYGARRPIEVQIDDGDDTVSMDVIDHGIGISQDDQARIFGRFERAVPERHYGGFGVGLWLSQQIVEAHGGTIAVHSTPGEGSTFTVTLPKRTP